MARSTIVPRTADRRLASSRATTRTSIGTPRPRSTRLSRTDSCIRSSTEGSITRTSTSECVRSSPRARDPKSTILDCGGATLARRRPISSIKASSLTSAEITDQGKRRLVVATFAHRLNGLGRREAAANRRPRSLCMDVSVDFWMDTALAGCRRWSFHRERAVVEVGSTSEDSVWLIREASRAVRATSELGIVDQRLDDGGDDRRAAGGPPEISIPRSARRSSRTSLPPPLRTAATTPFLR